MNGRGLAYFLRATGCLSLFILLTVSEVAGQHTQPDTAFIQQARTHAVQAYADGIGQALPALQGKEWVSIAQKIKGHPFYGSTIPSAGSVSYNGIEYTHRFLQYDILADELIILPNGDGLRLTLPKQKVTSFIVGDDQFIRPDAALAALGLTDTGYYRQLYKGPSMVLVRHWKEIRYQPGEEIHEAYIENKAYYMMDGKRFQLIAGEQDLLSLKGKKNKELKKMLAERKIRFRKNPEQALLAACAYYDRLP